MNYDFIKSRKSIYILVGVVIVALLVWWLFMSPSKVAAPTGETQQPASNSSNTSAPAGTGSKVNSGKIPSTPSYQNIVALITPTNGEIWSLGTSHSIRWTRKVSTGAVIELIDSVSGLITGWIAPSVSAGQVSYQWDTKSVFIGATNPLKKDINPGLYKIKVTFGGSNGYIESVPFSIVGVPSERILIKNDSIYNSIFSPNVIDAVRGETVAITNGESNNNRTITMNGVILATLAPGESYIFNTTSYPLSSYEFRLTANPVAKLTVNISQ